MIHHDVRITVIARSIRRRHRRHFDDDYLAASNHSHRKWSLAEKVSIPFTNHSALLLSITSALLMLRFTSSPSEWGLIGVAKRRRGSGNSDRYPNPPRGAASPPASFALVVGDGGESGSRFFKATYTAPHNTALPDRSGHPTDLPTVPR